MVSIYDADDIEHHLTKPDHHPTRQHVEQISCTIKKATAWLYLYGCQGLLRQHFELLLALHSQAWSLEPCPLASTLAHNAERAVPKDRPLP